MEKKVSSSALNFFFFEPWLKHKRATLLVTTLPMKAVMEGCSDALLFPLFFLRWFLSLPSTLGGKYFFFLDELLHVVALHSPLHVYAAGGMSVAALFSSHFWKKIFLSGFWSVFLFFFFFNRIFFFYFAECRHAYKKKKREEGSIVLRWRRSDTKRKVGAEARSDRGTGAKATQGKTRELCNGCLFMRKGYACMYICIARSSLAVLRTAALFCLCLSECI